MKKHFLIMLLVLAMLLVGCAPTAAPSDKPAADKPAASDDKKVEAAADPLILTVATTAATSTDPESSIYYYAGLTLGEELERVSGGQMGIDFVMGGVYGSTVQHFAQVKAGTLDVFISGFDVATNLEDGQGFFVAAAPYVFENNEHLNMFLESDIFAEMNEAIRKANGVFVSGLLFNQTPRILTAKKPIVHPSEIQGIKIRVPDSQSQLTVWAAAGASPTLVAPSDMYSHLETGIVDAQENDVVASASFALYEVTPYYMETNYMQQCFLAYMSDITWNKLTEQQQAWWNEALAATCEKATAKWLGKYESAKQTAIDAGATFVEIDFDEWKEFFPQIVLDELDGKYFPAGLYTEVQNLYNK